VSLIYWMFQLIERAQLGSELRYEGEECLFKACNSAASVKTSSFLISLNIDHLSFLGELFYDSSVFDRAA